MMGLVSHFLHAKHELMLQPDDVAPLLLLKAAAPLAGPDLDSMKATARALKERSLDLFKQALKDYQDRKSPSGLGWNRTNPQNCNRTPSSEPISPSYTTLYSSRI